MRDGNRSRSTSRRHWLWWVRAVLGGAATVALIAGGLVAFWLNSHAQQAPPGPIIELPPVTVPLRTNHWPGGSN